MEGDKERLPEGFRRTGYDSDTSRYLFVDRNRNLYQGPPGAEYGELTRLPQPYASLERERPSALAHKRSNTTPFASPSTFHDIIPPEMITNSSSSDKSSQGGFDTLRKSTLPNAVSNLQRSVTSIKRSLTSRRPRERPPIASFQALSDGDGDTHESERKSSERSESQPTTAKKSNILRFSNKRNA